MEENKMKNTIKTIVTYLVVVITLGLLLGNALKASGFKPEIHIAYTYNKPVVEVHYEEERKEVLDF